MSVMHLPLKTQLGRGNGTMVEGKYSWITGWCWASSNTMVETKMVPNFDMLCLLSPAGQTQTRHSLDHSEIWSWVFYGTKVEVQSRTNPMIIYGWRKHHIANHAGQGLCLLLFLLVHHCEHSSTSASDCFHPFFIGTLRVHLPKCLLNWLTLVSSHH